MAQNYNRLATSMIKQTARSEAAISTQWAGVVPLYGWVMEFPKLLAPTLDMAKLQKAIERQLRKLTLDGLKAPNDVPFGGFRLGATDQRTVALCLYSQFDPNKIEEVVEQARASIDMMKEAEESANVRDEVLQFIPADDDAGGAGDTAGAA